MVCGGGGGEEGSDRLTLSSNEVMLCTLRVHSHLPHVSVLTLPFPRICYQLFDKIRTLVRNKRIELHAHIWVCSHITDLSY